MAAPARPGASRFSRPGVANRNVAGGPARTRRVQVMQIAHFAHPQASTAYACSCLMSLRAWLVAVLFGVTGCPQSDSPELTEPCVAGSPDCPAACAPRTVGNFELCTSQAIDSYTVTARYTGDVPLDLDRSELLVAGEATDVYETYDPETRTLTITGRDLTPGKYSVLFRASRTDGTPVRPLFVPLWIGDGRRVRRRFTWRDAIVYQIFTDRFLDGNPQQQPRQLGRRSRARDGRRSHWQGGDFAGITQKIHDGYFDAMGVNTLWISSPIINSHNSQPAVGARRYAPVRELSRVSPDRDRLHAPRRPRLRHADRAGVRHCGGAARARQRGARARHPRHPRLRRQPRAREARFYQTHPEWFFPYNAVRQPLGRGAHRLLVHDRHARLRLRREPAGGRTRSSITRSG